MKKRRTNVLTRKEFVEAIVLIILLVSSTITSYLYHQYLVCAVLGGLTCGAVALVVVSYAYRRNTDDNRKGE